MADLHQKLAGLQGLLPSQRQWLDRLVFQLDFNPYQHIRVVGCAGGGKSTMALAIADLLSEDFNLALLTASPAFSAAQIRQHLLDNWFGFGGDGHKSLLQLVGERQSSLPLGLVIDQADDLPDELWGELAELPCLVIAISEQSDPHAELNLPLSPINLEDARVLLRDQEFGTLTLADRLDRAHGNIHFLLDPQLAKVPSKKAKVTKPSGLSPLAVFITGMAVIGGVVIFWLWTEKQRAQNGLGELTYLPDEPSVATAPVVNKPLTPQPSTKDIDALVNKLDKADPVAGSASKLERPAEFDFGQDTPSRAQSTEQTTSPSAAQSAAQSVDTSVAATKTATSEPVQAAVTNTTVEQETVVAPPQPAADQLIDPLKAQKVVKAEPKNEQQLPDEKPVQQQATVVENAIVVQTEDVADELASIAGNSDAIAETATAESTAPSTQHYQYQEDKLLGFSADQVALQLVVFSNEAALRNFKQSYAGLPTFVYQRQKNGQRQLVVVLAPFADSQTAKANLSTLPPALQTGFVKSIADIQSEIKQQ